MIMIIIMFRLKMMVNMVRNIISSLTVMIIWRLMLINIITVKMTMNIYG